VVLLAVLVPLVTGEVLALRYNGNAPVEAVREYVDAIARGDADRARELVNPGGYGAGVEGTRP
jgi:hypothetical protein